MSKLKCQDLPSRAGVEGIWHLDFDIRHSPKGDLWLYDEGN